MGFEVAAILGVVVFVIGFLIVGLAQEKQNPTYDATDDRWVNKKEFNGAVKLAATADQFEVIVYGQAGKVKSHEAFAERDAAVSRALKAFSRTGLDEIKVHYDKFDKLVISRGIYNGRGRREGNVVGEVHVYAINPRI